MNWLDKYQNKILIAIWSAIFLTCLFVIFSDHVYAATGTNTEIPYNVSEWSDYNQMMLPYLEAAISNYFNIANNIPSDTPLLIWTQDGYYSNKIYQFYIMPSPEFENSIVSSFDFSQNTITFHTDYEIGVILIHKDGSFLGSSWPHTQNASLLGVAGSVETVNGFYLPRYPFYYNGEPIKSTNDLEVLISRVNGGGGVINSGHATEPINDPDNIIKDDQDNPIIFRPNKPTPTPFTPQPFNPPSIDTSTLETLVESLIDVVEYGFNYIGGVISGAFSNMLSNLGAWVDYIVESFNFGFNNVVKAIQNLATDFYNNMVSLFEPLYDFFNGVATFFKSLIQLGMDGDSFSLSTFIYNLIIPDPDDLASALIENDEFGFIPLVSALKTKVSTVYDSIFNLSATKIFTLPSFTAFGVSFPSYQIDFSWFDNYKVYSDAIISGFLVIGYFHWLFITISSHIRGGSVIAGDVTVPDKKGGHP